MNREHDPLMEAIESIDEPIEEIRVKRIPHGTDFIFRLKSGKVVVITVKLETVKEEEG